MKNETKMTFNIGHQQVSFTEEQMSVVENIVDEYRIRLTEVGLEINKENLDEYKDGLIEKFEMFEKIGVVNIPLQNVYSFIQEEDGELEEYKCGFRIEE